MISELFDLASTLIASSAWPIATVMIVVLLRRQVQSLVDRLETAKTKWGDFTFSKVIQEIEAEFARIEQPAAAARLEETDEPVTNQVYAPVAEIMSEWVEVEQLCKHLLAKAGASVPSNYRALGSRLKRYEVIDAEHANILDKLRQVRNIAVHRASEDLTAEDAQNFAELVDRMKNYLRRRLAEV